MPPARHYKSRGNIAPVPLFPILAPRDGVLPPTLNFENPDPMAEGLDLVGPEKRVSQCEYVLSNGFGGVNASVIFGLV